jgi:hypothetical protein
MLNRAIVDYVLNAYYDSEAYQTNFERKPNADVADLLKRAEHIDLIHINSIPVLILGYDAYDLVILIQQPGKLEVYAVVRFYE